MTTAVITGSASGIGAATRARLESEGFNVIGIDLRNAEIEADLSTPEGRQKAVSETIEKSNGKIDRLVLAAGLGGQAICTLQKLTPHLSTLLLEWCDAALLNGAPQV